MYTSAGVSAGIDLALALVEDDHGADLVREVARSLVVFLKRSGGQSQFSAAVEAKPPKRSTLRAVTEAVAAEPAADHNVKALASQAGLSTRQLTRLFQTELGTTPARYVEAIRIDAARAALDAGSSVADAARTAGLRQPGDVAQGVHRRARHLPEGVPGSVPVHRARLGLGRNEHRLPGLVLPRREVGLRVATAVRPDVAPVAGS